MGRVVAIGTEEEVGGLALAGVAVVTAYTDDRARAAWRSIGKDVAVVVVGPEAQRAIGADLWAPGAPLTIAIPGREGPA